MRDAFCERDSDAADRKGRGLTLHIAPSNMPTMFAYSWITSLLSGNTNVVRISSRPSEVTETALAGIRSVLTRPEFEEIAAQNAFVTFPRGGAALEEISQKAAARVIWGGDETVENICRIPKGDGCIDITFPDKYSIALLKESDIEGATDSELRHMAHLFYNDTYGADQNACSSPQTVFWLKDGSCDASGENPARKRWWDAVAKEAENYHLEAWIATEKYRMLCRTYALKNSQQTSGQSKCLGPVWMWGNRLYVVPAEGAIQDLTSLEGRFGIFYEQEIESLTELLPYMESKIQTIVYSGSDPEDIYQTIRDAGCAGVDRVTALGEALDFSTVWDRKDLVEMLSCTFLNETKNSKTE